MPRKSRKSRRPSYRGQTAPKPPASGAVKEPQQPIASAVKQAPVRKPVQSGSDLIQRQSQHLRSDIRRIFVCAGICLAVLIVVYFLVR